MVVFGGRILQEVLSHDADGLEKRTCLRKKN